MTEIISYTDLMIRCKKSLSTLSHRSLIFATKDIQQNIDKINKLKSIYQVTTIQEGIDYEKSKKTSHNPNSFTDAIFWLNETLNFITIFVDLCNSGESVKDAFNSAYHRRLSNYHSFLIKGTFTIANRIDMGSSEILTKVSSLTDEDLKTMKNMVNEIDVVLIGWVPN
jgi:hypothetical protein